MIFPPKIKLWQVFLFPKTMFICIWGFFIWFTNIQLIIFVLCLNSDTEGTVSSHVYAYVLTLSPSYRDPLLFFIQPLLQARHPQWFWPILPAFCSFKLSLCTSCSSTPFGIRWYYLFTVSNQDARNSIKSSCIIPTTSMALKCVNNDWGPTVCKAPISLKYEKINIAKMRPLPRRSFQFRGKARPW